MKTLAKIMAVTIFAIFCIFICSGWAGSSEDSRGTRNSEIIKLKTLFEQNVGNLSVENDYWQDVSSDMLKTISGVGEDFSQSQYFIYVDRDPKKQFIFVCYYDATSRDIILIGADKVSTGNPNRGKGFFITPLGVYKNTVDIIGYRSLGTKNDKNWRGLGIKGMRVWDFGWHQSRDGRGTLVDIRLLMHATDPDFGEQRLGQPDSKGCVRISHKLNIFLDHYGLIDQEYEVNKSLKRLQWLLDKHREPATYAGKYVIVGDSGLKTSN
ncbi:MAG: hypothetical protein AAB378_02650 [Patescibacteria group bacterium]